MRLLKTWSDVLFDCDEMEFEVDELVTVEGTRDDRDTELSAFVAMLLASRLMENFLPNLKNK